MTAAQRRLLVRECMACNREVGQPMCDLCSDLEEAEERAETEGERDE